jgi:TolB-like protein/tetratricopeptide (TPR) repeat protein
LRSQCPDGTPPPCAGARSPLPTLVVAPFENRSRDSGDAYLAETLTEDVTAALAATRAVRVLGAHGGPRPMYRVSGSVRRVGDVVRVTAQIERAATGEVRWETRIEGPLAEGSILRDSVVKAVLASLHLRSGGGAAAPARRVDPITYDLWLRARYLLPRRRQDDEAEAVALIRRALARDSGFAPAWAELARALQAALSYGFTVPGLPRDSLLPRMLAASERALLLDSVNVDMWRLRVNVALFVDPTSGQAPFAAVRRALALDTADAATWYQYAMVLETIGRPDSAAIAYRRAAVLNPSQPLPMYALHWLWARRYDSAAVWAERAVSEDPTLMFAREMVGEVALARGHLDEAEAAYDAALRLGTGPEQVRALGGLAIVAAGLGDIARARGLIARAEAVTDSVGPTLHAAVSIAEAYAASGAPDRALTWLGRYQPRGDLHFQLHLAHDPTLDPLRTDPRFQRLVAETRPRAAP